MNSYDQYLFDDIILTSAVVLIISASSIGTIACAIEKATPPTKITEEKIDYFAG